MKSLKIFGYLTVASMFFTSCDKDKLEPIPQTFISDAVAFATPSRAAQQVNGLYAALKQGQFYAGRYQVYQDVRGEEFLNETNNGVTAFLTWNFTVTPTANEVQNLWGAAYSTINRANVVIAGLENSPIEAALRSNYIAEAKVIRALSYYSLLQMYARPFADGNGSKPGVPLRLTPATSSGDNALARATVAEVYTQILKDLNEAETALPQTYSTTLLNVTRVHRNTAIALKTRVYLAMGQYANVITEANKIVSAAAPFQATTGVQHRLAPSIADVFTNTHSTPEHIFSLPFTGLDLPGTQNSLGSYYNPGPDGNGDFSVNTTGNGIAADPFFTATDARRSFLQVTGGKTYLRKWPRNPGSTPDWVPVIRYAEVLLTLSEALARTEAGVSARAVELLNAVHRRSDPGTTLAPASKDELISMILKERRIELMGEGFRTSDITRLLLPFPAKGSISALPPSAPQYIWPISNAELITNPLIRQNEGY